MKTSTMHNIRKKLLSNMLGKKVVYFILRLLNAFLSDKIYLKILYRIRIGKKLNLKKPAKFTEKLQWLKLHERSELLTLVADKYKVREYIAKEIGSEFLIPLIGVYDKFGDINFNKLPEKFILKANHGSGWNILCTDKNKFDIKKARNKFNLWMKTNAYWSGRSWEYKNIKPRIVCEEFMSNPGEVGMADYKIHCFNGTPTFIQMISNRSTGSPNESFYDANWKLQNFTLTYPLHKKKLMKPAKLSKMLEIAKILSANFKYARVDLYVNKNIFFGEITLRPASGMDNFTPKSYDEKLGSLLKLYK